MNLKEFCEKNWYELATTIPENWDRYQDKTPSVTTILSLLIDRWFEYVKKNYKDALEQAVKKWTKMHNDAETFFNTWWEINKHILKFHILYDVEIIWQEQNYKTDYQWTIDLIADVTYKEKRIRLNVDYKSSLNRSEKYRLQLAWYKCLNGNDWALLYIGKDKYIFDVFNTEEYVPAFLELKDYFFKLLWQQHSLAEGETKLS